MSSSLGVKRYEFKPRGYLSRISSFPTKHSRWDCFSMKKVKVCTNGPRHSQIYMCVCEYFQSFLVKIEPWISSGDERWVWFLLDHPCCVLIFLSIHCVWVKTKNKLPGVWYICGVDIPFIEVKIVAGKLRCDALFGSSRRWL